jgi:hypothetical protein
VLDQVRTAPTTPAFARRAGDALFELSQRIDAAEPLRFEVLRIIGAVEAPALLVPVFDFLEKRVAGNPRSESRYRWELTHRVGVKHPAYAPSERTWTAWRDGDAQLRPGLSDIVAARVGEDDAPVQRGWTAARATRRRVRRTGR